MTQRVEVVVVMGSISDWEQMQGASHLLDQLNIKHDRQIISAHRMPVEMMRFAENAQANGYKVIISGAGGAAHLPGMIASSTSLPVIGVPIKSSTLSGIDSLLSIVQMPAGVPVATMAIGAAGAKNAALMAARILATTQENVRQALANYQSEQHQKALESSDLLYD